MTRHATSRTLLISLLLTASAVSAIAQNTPARADYREGVIALRAEIEHEMSEKHLNALSVALVDGDSVVWAEGFGFEDAARMRPATAHTIYRVGSVSKLFTDVAVMQMVDQRKLSLDAPVSQVLPTFHPKNPFGGQITLRQLMSHQAGLTREPPIGHYFDSSSPSLKETVDSLNETTLVFAPGTHFKYSNAGVATVGYALQRVSGQPFAAYVRRSVLDPLSMSESSFTPEPQLASHLAEGRMWSYDGLDFVAPTFQLGEGPAGSMYTSVLDLSRFLRMVFNKGRAGDTQILSSRSLDEMLTPQFGGDYGLGFSLEKLDGAETFGHGGEIYGFTTQLTALRNEKLGVVVVTNTDDVNAVTEHLADDALRIMLAIRNKTQFPTLIKTELPDRDIARKSVGIYRGTERDLTLEEQNGHLIMSRSTGGNLFELRQKGRDFITDSRLSWWSMGVALHGDSLTAKSETYVKLPAIRPAKATQWLDLIGEYGWKYDKLFIFEDHGSLHMLVEWFDFEPMEQLAQDTFVLPDQGFYQAEKVVFVRDAGGEITGVRIGEVAFPRLHLAPDAESFHLRSLKSASDLRREALSSKPPTQRGQLRAVDLIDVPALDPTIKLDVRYATTQNFLGFRLYAEQRALLQKPAAEALARVAARLRTFGYGLVVYDAYQPWFVTKMIWGATPEDKKSFVADPREGSLHNRGCAVDLTLYDLATGMPVTMTSGYGEMSERATAFYPGGTALQRWQRDLLRYSMEEEGYNVSKSQWWHFDYKDWARYPVMNLDFADPKLR